MKVAPLYHVLRHQDWCTVEIVHTGQHYDPSMSDAFFSDLGLPDPTHHLGVGSGGHGEQTGRVMIEYERVCLDGKPDCTVVVGDVNSTAACALVARKLHVVVAHLEAGLRSGDRRMPEEINRLVTDAISDMLWTPSMDANENLMREGVPKDRIEFVGNIMIDSFEMLRKKIRSAATVKELGLEPQGFAVCTLHRPSNVDNHETLDLIIENLCKVAAEVPVVFAVHPRTKKQLQLFDLLPKLENTQGVKIVEPLGYIQFMNLVEECRVVITDSGGIQEETTYLGIPCLTLREKHRTPCDHRARNE